MSSDSEKLAAIEKAILDLQLGKRVTSVSYGDMHVQYASADLNKLLEMRAQIKNAIGKSGPRQVIFSTSKGLR